MFEQSGTWIHKDTGKKYRLMCVANTDAYAGKVEEPTRLAVYIKLSDSTIWARPFEDFKQRFVKLEEDPIIYRNTAVPYKNQQKQHCLRNPEAEEIETFYSK